MKNCFQLRNSVILQFFAPNENAEGMSIVWLNTLLQCNNCSGLFGLSCWLLFENLTIDFNHTSLMTRRVDHLVLHHKTN